jgi:hypothetical protein
MITRRKWNSFGDAGEPLNYDREVSCASSKKVYSSNTQTMVDAVPDKLMLAKKIVGRYCLTHDGVCAENGKCLPATQHVDLYPDRMCKKVGTECSMRNFTFFLSHGRLFLSHFVFER